MNICTRSEITVLCRVCIFSTLIDTCKQHICFNGKILKAFPWHWESLSFNILLVFSDSVEREENNKKSMKIGKKEIKPSSVTGDIIMCV